MRRSRERFWGKDMPQDKINAYMTLYTALVTTSKAAAPMIPFMAESIYQNLVRSLDKGCLLYTSCGKSHRHRLGPRGQ